MKILIINGPNLNMLGKREERFYGNQPFEKILEDIRGDFEDMEIDYFQSNTEGEIVTRIQELLNEDYGGLIINPGAYSHYSLAIMDALFIFKKPKVEVHLSNIHARHEMRAKSVTAKAVNGLISGFGKYSYRLAVEWFRHNQPKKVGFK